MLLPMHTPELFSGTDQMLGVVQERESVRIHRVPGEVSDVRWPPGVANRVDLPLDCNAGDLAEVLEFLKVSQHHTHVHKYQRPRHPALFLTS